MTTSALPAGREPLLHLDPAGRSATRDGRTVTLTALEFGLLAALARRPGATCTAEMLLREVWGAGADRRRLEVLVSRLRCQLAHLEVRICTVPKRGYRLEETG